MKKIILIAHRGKGPTSNKTAPSDELWKDCFDNDLLINNLIVPKNILLENGLGLPNNIPPENTLAAFRQGLNEGADAIELDIFLSSDFTPMSIHDNELNRNVSGALRTSIKQNDLGYLGLVSDYSMSDLKQFDMWNGHNIPSLMEVIQLINKIDIERSENDKETNPIILNIEFKDKTSYVVQKTISVVTEASNEGYIQKSNIIFCSFDHTSLEEAVKLDQESQVSMALKTAFLFGKENVDMEAGWIVQLGVKYNSSAIGELEEKILSMKEIENSENGKLVALDAVLWDIDQDLIELVIKHELTLHASTSNFRKFDDILFICNLVKISDMVQVYFKTDEPKKVKDLLEHAYDAYELELNKVEIKRVETILDKIDISGFNFDIQDLHIENTELDLRNVTITEVSPILRIGKPGQGYPDGYIDSMKNGFDGWLVGFLAEHDNDLIQDSSTSSGDSIVYLDEYI